MTIKKLVLLVMIAAMTSCAPRAGGRDVLFQTSVINALPAGAYDGDMTIGRLKKHGGPGIGAFNALDGEMVALGGSFYQVRSDGSVVAVPDTLETPFAVVTFFEPDARFEVSGPMSCEELETFIDARIPDDDIFYAIRGEVELARARPRSVPPQPKPYPLPADAVREQSVFELGEVEGTLVGFRSPAFVSGVNVPGNHLHFISDDRSSGGHVLSCELSRAVIELDYTRELFVVLPGEASLKGIEAGGDRRAELDKVEGGGGPR